MKKLKHFLSVLLALALVLSMTACAGDKDPGAATDPTAAPSADTVPYRITVRTQGSMALSGIGVYIYAGTDRTNMIDFGQTDEQGQVSFELPQRSDYSVVLSGVPKGYAAEESYAFSGNAALITLTSSLITGEPMGSSLKAGDVMYDFTVTTPDGTKLTLSEILADKKLVLLNFWYVGCSWCVEEFPYMQQAYEQYSDDVAVIALNPMDDDSAIRSFQSQYGLTFPMAACPTAWSQSFGIQGYPTSVFIDRYGVISLIEAGAITSLRPFTHSFEHFTAEPYEQGVYGNLGELVSNVKPTFTMPPAEEVSAVLDGGSSDITYRPETDPEDSEYAWPFIITEKNGVSCMKASNQGIEASYAIMYADVYLQAGQAVGLDYLTSTEKGCDILHIIVNDEPVYQISGVSAEEGWQTCYPWVAEEAGQYEIALCYLKDGDGNEGDDTVYLKNLRIVSTEEIEAPSYIPRYAAVADENDNYTYATIVYSEADGYYHVGTADGPLLLADLMNYTQLSESKTVWDIVYEGIATLDGKNFYDDMVSYFSYASNSTLSGACTVNKELARWLKIVSDNIGFDGTENEWLKVCKYYQAYGTDSQLTDPIKGLAPFSAFEAKLGKNIESNSFYYDRPIMPRGLLAKFTAPKAGVYRITSRSESIHGVEGWIFDENRSDNHYTYEHDERRDDDGLNVSMLYYLAAGESCYIDIAFWDIYEAGTIYYDIEYMGATYDLLRLASPSYYTYDTDATGEAMYDIIAGGIKVILGPDGYYYQDLGKDAGGNQKYGSLLYADFTGTTGVFSHAIATVGQNKGMIDMGGFDFSKTENDQYVISILEKYNCDTAAADAYLREYWGEDYEANAAEYKLQEVYEGILHGRGLDYTAEMRAYLSKMITSGATKDCVPVDQRLAELLQMIMDKYTFAGVESSWTKLCYYIDHMGPEN